MGTNKEQLDHLIEIKIKYNFDIDGRLSNLSAKAVYEGFPWWKKILTIVWFDYVSRFWPFKINKPDPRNILNIDMVPLSPLEHIKMNFEIMKDEE